MAKIAKSTTYLWVKGELCFTAWNNMWNITVPHFKLLMLSPVSCVQLQPLGDGEGGGIEKQWRLLHINPNKYRRQ